MTIKNEPRNGINQFNAQALLDSISDGVALISTEYDVLEMNQAGLSLFGLTREAIAGQKCYKLVHGLDSLPKECSCPAALRIQKTTNSEFTNGSHWYLTSSTPMLDADGQVTALAVTFRDITRRKQMEEDLQASHDHFQSLFHSIPEALFILDDKGKIHDINRVAEERYGYTRAEFLSMTGKDLAAAKTIKTPGVFLNKSLQSRTRFEWVHQHKEGWEMPVEIEAVPIQINDRKFVLSSVRDIGERLQAEKALADSESKFYQVLKQANDGFYVLQGDHFVFINPRFTEITGYTFEEINGPDFDFRILLTDNGRRVIAEREAAHRRGEFVPPVYVFECLKKNGLTVDLEVSVTHVEWDGEPATLGVLHDVSARVQSQKRLEEALLRAEQSEHVKTSFLSNISHEIRTPLNSLLGFTDLIEDSTREHLSPEEKEFFKIIRDSGARLMRTVHEILDISQMEAGAYRLRLETFDLVELLTEVTLLFKPVIETKGLKLIIENNIPQAVVEADRELIKEALGNLLDNAMKYTESGRIRITLADNRQKYILIMEDTGIGMSEEYLSDLFDIFTQESSGHNKKYQGLGLGLSIAKRYLDVNKVEVEVSSKKNIGSKFTIKFNKFRPVTSI